MFMKQISSEKYTIAWFKLAECVSRGERERALGVYRLLSHSIGDPAYVCQLEGDILLAFGDVKQAIHMYQEAINCYMHASKLLEAAAVYNHLITLEPTMLNYYLALITLYYDLGLTTRIDFYLDKVISILVATPQRHEIEKVLGALREINETYYCYVDEYLREKE